MVEKCFHTIEIRDLNFEYDRYYLSLEEDPKEFLITDNLNIKNNLNKGLPNDAISDITPYTIVPKFSIDKINTPILFQIFNINYDNINKNIEKEISNINDIDNSKNKIVSEKEGEEENNINNVKPNLSNEKLYLKSINITELTLCVKSLTSHQIVFSFQLRYPLFSDFYTYLGENPEKFKILQFPCILLQYESGSIITNTNQQKKKSNKNKGDNIKDDNKIKFNLNSGYYALKKIILSKKNDEYYDEEINFAISPSMEGEQNKKYFGQLFTNRQKPMKKKEINYIKLQNILDIKGTYDSTLSTLEEKKKELNKKKEEIKFLIEKRNAIMNKRKEVALYEKKIELNKNSWNRLVTLKEILNKINTYTSEVILLKEKKIEQSQEIINKYWKEVEEKKYKKIPYLQKINKGLQISNTFLIKYAINEICYFFFNKNLNIYNAFPSFFKSNINSLMQNKKTAEEFYISHNREVSTMFGNMVYLLTYISKKFDIIFPYVLYYNGSKSMAFLSMGAKNSSIDLYMKENEREGNDIFLKMEIISKMIYDTIMFFYAKRICSDKFNIDEFNNRKKKKKNNMYINFIKLNEIFKDLLGKYSEEK